MAAASRASSGAGTLGTHVALLRGINVGASNRLKMSDLIGLFTDAGCADARAYIQSGNLVFGAGSRLVENLPRVLEAEINAHFGIRVPVLIRSGEQFRRAAAENPFVKAGADPAELHVGFLADVPERSLVAALDRERSPGDSFEVRGGEIFMHLAGGMGGTKLTNAYFDSALKTVCTVRNWRTVLALVEMIDERRG